MQESSLYERNVDHGGTNGIDPVQARLTSTGLPGLAATPSGFAGEATVNVPGVPDP